MVTNWRQALKAENERAEWKQSDEADGILRAECALANDLGESGQTGHLLIGIDRQGRAVGADASDQGQQRVVNRLSSTRILPTPSFSIEAAEHEGKTILVVSVQPYPVPPIVKVDSVAWVRVGPTTRRASEADLARLRERRPEHLRPFDLRPALGCELDELDLGGLRSLYQAGQVGDSEAEGFPPFEKWLGQHDILTRSGGAWVPTVAGLLVWGLCPQGHLPGASIEFARYAGTDFDAPIALRKTITGRLPDQLQALWGQLQINLVEVPGDQEGIRSPYNQEYPLEALKELARNLVQHRLYEGTNAPARVTWFDDRVVFNNPGQPFGHASEGEFGENSDYRNPTVTRLLVEQGYVERLGRGVRRVRALLAKNGNPPMEVQTNGYTAVTIRRRT